MPFDYRWMWFYKPNDPSAFGSLANSRLNISGENAYLWEPLVAPPTFDPIPGTYTLNINVTLSCETPGASIYYTTDGSTPVPGNPGTSLYITPIYINYSQTIKAIGTKPLWTTSTVSIGNYFIVLLCWRFTALYNNSNRQYVLNGDGNYPKEIVIPKNINLETCTLVDEGTLIPRDNYMIREGE